MEEPVDPEGRGRASRTKWRPFGGKQVDGNDGVKGVGQDLFPGGEGKRIFFIPTPMMTIAKSQINDPLLVFFSGFFFFSDI